MFRPMEELARGRAPGWYRGWNGMAHLFPRGIGPDDTTAPARCGGLLTVGPWPEAWGPPLSAKPDCYVCRRLEREDAASVS
jgi:hypothetical protein